MRLLKVKKNDFSLDKSNFRLFPKPIFPFVGNKSNRRNWILNLIKVVDKKLLSGSMSEVFDVFGGSFYLSHIVQVAANQLHKNISCYTNDYDNYSGLFKPENMEHLMWYKSVCDKNYNLKRNELLPEEDCQLIDDYTKRNCPHMDD